MTSVTRAPSGHRCGHSHHRAKLSDDAVRALRSEFEEKQRLGVAGVKNAKYGYEWFARKYGAPWPTVRDIVTYRTRRNA